MQTTYPKKCRAEKTLSKGRMSFLTKLVFLAAGLLDKFKPIYDCSPVREYVASVNEGKTSFPALEMEEDKFMMLKE